MALSGTPMEKLKRDYDGVIRLGTDTRATFVAMPADALARAGFKSQREAFVHEDVCAADLIAVATAAKAVSAFSTGHQFIFTLVSSTICRSCTPNAPSVGANH